MGLSEDLRSDDDATRLAACRRAVSEGGLEHVPALLELALTDRADVRTIGGIAEHYERVSHAAAGALGAIFQRLGETESAARAVATDLRHDDELAGELLYFLGKPAEAVRRELESHPEPRVRLRALKAVLSTHRTPELVQRMLADPSPLVRREAATSSAGWDGYPRVLLSEPAPEVRLEIARQLRAGARHLDVILRALERERAPDVRLALVQCLPPRWQAGAAVTEALRKALDEADPRARRVAAEALKQVGSADVGEAIAARVPVETDRLTLYALLSYNRLAQHGKAVLPFVASLFLATKDVTLRSASLHALVRFGWCELPPVLPLATSEDEDTRRAAHFLLASQPSPARLAQVKALKSDGGPVKVSLEDLVAKLSARLAETGVEVLVAAPVTDDGGSLLELPGRTVPFAAAGALELAAGEAPSVLSLRLSCGRCSGHARVRLPVRYQSMDDDRFAARETTYEAGGWMNCPWCRAAKWFPR